MKRIFAAVIAIGLSACVSDLAGKSSTPTPPSGDPATGDSTCADKTTHAGQLKADGPCTPAR